MAPRENETFVVLLAEDDPGDANLVKAAFADGPFHCKIEHVWDGIEAMAWLKEAAQGQRGVPDLLILDINMPRKNGLEVLAEVKGNGSLRDIPVVILTTSEAERDVVNAYQAGASGYLSKPVDVDNLFNAIHGVENYWFGVMRLPR